MPVIAIPIPLTPALSTTIVTAVAAVSVITNTLKIPLTPAETAQQLPVSTNREAVIDAIQTRLMQGHPSTLPTGLTNVIFQALNQQGDDCDSLIVLTNGILNTLLDLRKVINNNRMCFVNQTLDAGKLMSKGDTGIKTDVNFIVSTYYKRGTPKVAVVNTLSEGGSLELAGVKGNRMLTNLGKGILSITNEVGEIADAILVNPDSAEKLPTSWKRILVTNLSATNSGKFSVFMK